MASRIESSALNGTIQVSQAVRDVLHQHDVGAPYRFKKRRLMLKGVGRVYAYTLTR